MKGWTSEAIKAKGLREAVPSAHTREKIDSMAIAELMRTGSSYQQAKETVKLGYEKVGMVFGPGSRDAKAAACADAFRPLAEMAVFGSVREYRFDPARRWRFDYAWPEHKVAIEVEGGVWTRGRHTRGTGFMRDMEKYNRAAVLGWRVIRCTPDTLAQGMATAKEAMKV